MTKFKKTTSSAAIAAMVALFSVAGNATVIDSTTNNPLAFSWSFDGGGATPLTGTGTLSVSGFNSTELTVAVVLNNTSQITGTGGERLTSFGFGIDPNATSISFSDAADGGMIDASLAKIPSLATIEVCAWGGNNCSGGANGGILAGESDSFSVLLAGTWGSSVDIAPIGFKYQTGYGSFEFFSSSGSSGQTSGPLPEPGMLSLLGVGLLGQAWLLRRRRQQQKK